MADDEATSQAATRYSNHKTYIDQNTPKATFNQVLAGLVFGSTPKEKSFKMCNIKFPIPYFSQQNQFTLSCFTPLLPNVIIYLR